MEFWHDCARVTRGSVSEPISCMSCSRRPLPAPGRVFLYVRSRARGGGLVGLMPHSREVGDHPGLRVSLQAQSPQLQNPARTYKLGFLPSVVLGLRAVLEGLGRKEGQAAKRQPARRCDVTAGCALRPPLSRVSLTSDVVASWTHSSLVLKHTFSQSHLWNGELGGAASYN